MQANRNGFFYVLDRTDGKLLLAKPFVKKLTWASGIASDGRPIQLLYVSPTQIYGQLPFSVDGNVTVRVTTANGFVETSV